MKLAIKSINQTKRQKRRKNKKQLWEKFDDMMAPEVMEESLECLYSKQQIGNRTHCEQCGYAVAYEERFLTH